MTYQGILENLNRRGLFQIKPGLERMQAVLTQLRQPQNSFRSIHIAGTNGKGSVAAGLESVLRCSGYRTGLYISPHLEELRERIQLNRRPISKRAFIRASLAVLGAEKSTGRLLTYFEFMTAVAFVAFQAEKVHVAVVECGLGGLWDATNTLKKPVASVITSIGLDHTQWLGHTEPEIAAQKAGIIKNGGLVISGVRGAAKSVIVRTARRYKTRLRQIDTDFSATVRKTDWVRCRQWLDFAQGGDILRDIPFNLVGSHQRDNAAIILETVVELRKSGWRISAEALRKGLMRVQWPGRFEVRTSTGAPPLLFDGAHNPAAIRCFLQTLCESNFQKLPKTFVFSAYRDKDYQTMAAMISPLASAVYLCSIAGARSLSLKQLKAAFDGFEGSLSCHASPAAALTRAMEDTPPEGITIITGSLALVGMLRKTLPTLRSKVAHV